MLSPLVDRAIADAKEHRHALLKFISANDAGLTGSHQCGFYLPREGGVWKLFTTHAPSKGRIDKSPVKILWPDGLTTSSVVTWYGNKTRSEYRLTRFGRGFSWLTPDLVGSLLILIPKSMSEFIAYVFDREDDIENLQAALGLQVVGTWAVYPSTESVESEDECVEKKFRAFVAALTALPKGIVFAERTREVLDECVAKLRSSPLDEQFLRWVQAEDGLFRMAERKVVQDRINRLFKTVDDFVSTALSILNARKSRAGKSLEYHFEHALRKSEIPFDPRPKVEDTVPDIIIPGKREYEDPSFPEKKLFMVGLKRTCKERWTQVLDEAPRIREKHILTIQEGISPAQLEKMHKSRVTLIVPRLLQKAYPRKTEISLIDIDEFIASVRSALAKP